MARKSSKRKSKQKKRSKGKRDHAYETAKPRVKLSPRPLIGLWQVRRSTVLSVLLLVTLALLTSQFFTTHRFYVYEAEVQGNRFVDQSEIYSASGLHEMSIFWIKPEQAEADISNLPGVKEAKVTCRLPNRVRIEVVERRALIIWQRGAERRGVDELGAILPLAGELEGMLLINDRTAGSFEVGDRIDLEVVTSALELWQLLPTAALQYSQDKGLSFEQWGYPIYFGAGDMAEKMAILNALLRDLSFEGIQPEFIDLRFKESPFYGH